MKVKLESTSTIIDVNGVPGRLWEGKTDSGIIVQAVITRISVHNAYDQSQFERELNIQRAPFYPVAFPLKMII